MTFTHTMDLAAQGFEAAGATALVIGMVLAVAAAVRAWRQSGRADQGYQVLREVFGGALLLGLEVLVAADLIRTVAVAPTLNNVVVLGLVVLIRTFLSFSLEVEIEGVAPWRRAVAGAANLGRRKRAIASSTERSATNDKYLDR